MQRCSVTDPPKDAPMEERIDRENQGGVGKMEKTEMMKRFEEEMADFRLRRGKGGLIWDKIKCL